MPITYGNANYRKKFDAFRIIDESGHEPLKEAVAVAVGMREACVKLVEAIETCKNPITRSQLILALSKAMPDQLNAWIRIAEFIYSKPKHITVDSHITYEQFLDGTWKDMLGAGTNGNG
jgi:hypothetical protein